MDFYAMVDQVVQLLQQRGRLTYRALQVQFQLDDATCEALKAEVLFAHPVVDHEGRGLIWTGAAEAPPARISAAPSAQTSPPPPAEAEPLPQGAPLATEQHIPDAERRQLTVMFCDLVDSTKLSSQLDPEDYRDVVRGYQKVCAEVITRFDGHIAQLLGDGLLIYFGYPHAHEDDAQRAVRTGLRILAAMEDLDTPLQREQGLPLAIRVGIHTGLVVVGAMGTHRRQEQLALGEVPNVASRIQGFAEPNTLMISADTYRLIQGYFACQDSGAQTLRGVAEPLHVYRVLQDSGARGRLDVAVTGGLTPLVGREQEVSILLERWNQVKAGHGQVVLLTGEAGIGKSRLVQVLKEHVAQEPHVRWECRSAEYAQNTALFPLVDLFQRLLPFEVGDTPHEKVGKLEQLLRQYRLPVEETVPLFAPLLALPLLEDRYPLLGVSPQRQRQKTLETIVTLLQEDAERHPVLFIVEDLHWTDPTTLELFSLVIEQIPTTSILTVLTCRPTFQPSWPHRSYMTAMTLHRLSHPQVAEVVAGVTDGKTFPPEVLQQILTKTDGVPLFVEEITKSLLESGQLQAVDGHYELVRSLSTFTIPATLQDSLMARLDTLMTGKVIAQLGATIGRQFSYALLQAVAQRSDRTLHEELHRLVEAELLYQRGRPPQATYVFKHALIQDAAYQSLLKSTRQHYHQRIAQVLEAQFAETVAAQPELLAHHYTEATLPAQAIPYWYTAGQQASERSAHREAIAHFRQGLALLQTLLETPERLQREAGILIALGASLRATQGTGALDVGETYTRARHLCQRLAEPEQLFPILRGLWNYHLIRAEYHTAYELGEQLFTLAQQAQDAIMLVAAHRALGATLLNLGAVAAAHTHYAQGMALDDQQHRVAAFHHGDDAGVACRTFDAWALWHLGYPEQGLTRSHEAVTLAQQVAHPFSLGLALGWAAVFHQLRREARCTQERAEAAHVLAQEQGFPYYIAISAMLRGWTLAQQGHVQEGITQITQGLRTYRATGAEILRSYFLALLAEVHGMRGQPAEGLTALAEALAIVDTRGERHYEAELYRLKGALLLLQQHAVNQAEAESCFAHAISIAQSQQAKSWELRAAMSLARLWQQQGKQAEAYELLAPIYGWFTEGFDTADLQEAQALLEELGE